MKRNQTVTYRPTTSMQSTSTFSLPRNTSSTTSTQEKVMSSLDGILSRRKTTPSRPQTHYGTTQQSPPTLLRKPSYKHAEGVRRHGWTEGGQQDDPVSQPTMKRIGVGLKLKQRYLIPDNLDAMNSFTAFATVCHKPLLGDAPVSKWKKRWIVVKDNKVYFMRKPKETVAVFFITLDDCVIDPQEFPNQRFSFRLLPPPGCIKETSQEMMWIVVADGEDQKLDFMEAFLKAAGWRERQLAASGTVPRITLIPAPDPEEEERMRAESRSPSPANSVSEYAPSDIMYFSSDESEGRASHDGDDTGPVTPPISPALWTDGSNSLPEPTNPELSRSRSSGSSSSSRSGNSFMAAAGPSRTPSNSSNASLPSSVPPLSSSASTASLPRPLSRSSTTSSDSESLTSPTTQRTPSPPPSSSYTSFSYSPTEVPLYPIPPPPADLRNSEQALLDALVAPNARFFRKGPSVTLQRRAATKGALKGGMSKVVLEEGRPKRRSTEPIRRVQVEVKTPSEEERSVVPGLMDGKTEGVVEVDSSDEDMFVVDDVGSLEEGGEKVGERMRRRGGVRRSGELVGLRRQVVEGKGGVAMPVRRSSMPI